CPLYPRKRTSSDTTGMCQKQTFALQQTYSITSSAGEQRGRHFEAERPGGVEVERCFVFGRPGSRDVLKTVNADKGTSVRPRSCPRERYMQTKTLQQTVTFKASPQEVYDMLMDSKKHQSLSGEPAKISKKVGGKFTAWGSHLSGINLVLK